jgi:magnesium/cobalt transport protein CorA
LSERRLLWVDLDPSDRDQLDQATTALGLESATAERLESLEPRPALFNHEPYIHLHLSVARPDLDPPGVVALGVVMGANFVVTVHRDEVPLLEALAEQVQGEQHVGELNAADFLAGILDRHIGGYLDALDAVESRVDAIDALALSRTQSRDLAPDLARLRRTIARLRRALAAHRDVYADLGRPELITISKSDSSHHFEHLQGRFDHAIEAMEQARDTVLGSVELFMMSTAQRTNDIMRLLTLVSVVMLPGVVIAGVMGMNFQVGLFDRAELFWVVIASMFALAALTIALARRRGWL